MTVYLCDRPFPLYSHPGGPHAFHLWADTRDEAEAALYGVGADPDTCRETWHTKMTMYAVSSRQFVELQALGVRVTDSLGPREWLARRDNDTHTLEWVLRRRGLQGR